MTPEEAKQLKTGDRVLIEAEVNVPGTSAVDEHGEVHLYVPNIMGKYFYCRPSSIREKLEPPRRKFKVGDIVKRKGTNRLYTVAQNENIGHYDIGLLIDEHLTDELIEELELVCAFDDRADRKEDA